MHNKTSTPFHDSETSVQARFGLAELLAERYKDFIRPYMPDQHRNFYASLPFVVVGLTDQEGKVWSTPLFGAEGFVQTPSATTLTIDAQIPLANVVDLSLSSNSKIGLLGIELGTRRRNRVNGVIDSCVIDSCSIGDDTNIKSNELKISVEQSYGNCPQYIHKRQIKLSQQDNLSAASSNFEKCDSISPFIKTSLENADTFFIASRTKTFSNDPRSGIDSSHRGGTQGFVRVNGNTLMFPDFSGNKFFNTIGNIEDDGRVGLFFPNFENGDALFISGKARILWDEHLLSQYEGAERFIEIECEQIISAKGFMPVHGDLTEASPSFTGKEQWHM